MNWLYLIYSWRTKILKIDLWKYSLKIKYPSLTMKWEYIYISKINIQKLSPYFLRASPSRAMIGECTRTVEIAFEPPINLSKHCKIIWKLINSNKKIKNWILELLLFIALEEWHCLTLKIMSSPSNNLRRA